MAAITIRMGRLTEPPLPRATIRMGRLTEPPLPRAMPPRLLAERLVAAALRPVPADSSAVFRICFGLLAAASSLRFLARGWVDALYLAPENHLAYAGFDWVRPWPAPWMHLHVAALAALGVCIALGWRTRLSAWLFTAGFAYTELIDAALYLNHYWYMTLAGLLIAVLPVGGRWSLDARAGRTAPSACVPAAVVWALRGQLAVVYAFAGLAKLNSDWLWQAQPMRLWLSDRADLPLIGHLLGEPAVAYLASWSGAVFDCTIAGWLLWRRSRPCAFAALVGFHAVTGWLFPSIGVFPWVMTAGALVFFPADWPRRLAGLLGAGCSGVRVVSGSRRAGCSGVRASAPRLGPAALTTLILLSVVQVILPLRHYAYPGDVRWTEEGYYLSWRVMLTEKAGYAQFEVTDPDTGHSWLTELSLVLTDWQVAQASIRPDLLCTAAHLVAEHYRRAGIADPQVRVDAWVSFNGRPAQRLVDADLDLAPLSCSRIPDGWVEPPDTRS